jgi:RNA recognition motif-containing protein
MAKLFVVGFPRDMDETELMELFSLHGLVNLVTIVTNKDTGESQGYGFVHMEDGAGAERAIAALNGAEIDDRTISVRFAEAKQENTGPVFQKVSTKKKRPRRTS